MEEQPEEQITLLNFSFDKFEFEYGFSAGFKFDTEFNRPDAGQLQNEPTTLDEMDLLGRLRDVKRRDSMMIPPTFYEYYDKCRKHFFNEFINLLMGYMANIEKAKILKQESTDGNLLPFFDIKLAGQLNFGNHQPFKDCAADCDIEIKAKLKACGKELQEIAQAGREKAVTAARTKLQACSADFMIFGESEWIKQCKRTSAHNILDQHFTVKGNCQIAATVDYEGDEDEKDEFRVPPPDNDRAQFEIWTMSTWLYNVAINDSKADVDIEIRRRRAQKIASIADMATLRARQTTVDLRADAVRPTDAARMLGDRFKRLDCRVDVVAENLASIKTANNAQATSSNPNKCYNQASSSNEALTQKVQELEIQVEALRTSVSHDHPSHASKNDSRADSAEMQQSAWSIRRENAKRRRAEAATPAVTTSTAPPTPRITMAGTQPPRPPNYGNGNERMSQHQHGHAGVQHQPRGRGQGQRHDTARPPQDERQRPSNVDQQPPRRGRGNGRGRGRDPGWE